VIEIFRRRALEGIDLAPLRIDAPPAPQGSLQLGGGDL